MNECGGVYYIVVVLKFRLNSDCNNGSLTRRHSHVLLGPSYVGGGLSLYSVKNNRNKKCFEPRRLFESAVGLGPLH